MTLDDQSKLKKLKYRYHTDPSFDVEKIDILQDVKDELRAYILECAGNTDHLLRELCDNLFGENETPNASSKVVCLQEYRARRHRKK